MKTSGFALSCVAAYCDSASSSLRRGGQARRWTLLWATALLLVASATGCGDLLEVEPADQVVEETIDNPGSVPLQVAGAVAAFECAFNSYVYLGGLIGNELKDSSLEAARFPYDRRDFQPDGAYGEADCTTLGVYKGLSSARFQAEYALENLRAYSSEEIPSRQALIAKAAAYAGYSYVLLGEGFCAVAIDESEALQPQEVFSRATERFRTAIEAAEAAGSTDILNMARVGLARARLNMEELSAAAQVAQAVPEGFVFNVTASDASARRENRIYDVNNRLRYATIEVPYREVAFEGVPDPRVPVADAGVLGFDGTTPLFVQSKYPTLSSPIPLATWEEAQLILAEAALNDDPQRTVELINTLHEQAGLPAFESSDTDEIREHLIQDRKRELFLESHHLWDIRRFDIPLFPAPGTPYPKGGTYEDNVCLPLPDIERFNNPNIPDS